MLLNVFMLLFANTTTTIAMNALNAFKCLYATFANTATTTAMDALDAFNCLHATSANTGTTIALNATTTIPMDALNVF